MKVIHISDLHIEGGFGKIGNDKNKVLKEESLQTFSRLVDFAQTNAVDVVLICGDLFDKLAVRKSTIKFLFDTIRKAHQIKFFYCLGNHDHSTSLEINKPDNLIIFSTNFEKYDLGDIVVGGASVLKFADNNLLKNIDFDKNRINFLMLHANILASRDNQVLNFDIKNLKNKFIDYLALGHIHTRMNGKIDDRGEWVYSGNGGEYCFGNHQRGFVLIEIKENKISWNYVNFDLNRKFLEMILPLDNIHSFVELETGAQKLLEKVGAQNFVRLCLDGECDEDLDKHLDLLFEKFNDKFFYFEIKDTSKIRIDIEKCRQEKLSLKAEFIKLIYDADITDLEKQQCVKAGIMALRGEEVEL